MFKRLVEKAIDVVEGVLREMELFDDTIKIEDKIPLQIKKPSALKQEGLNNFH